MDWVVSIRQAIAFMEEHLLDMRNADTVAEEVYISSFYLQTGFRIMTGYSIAEYVRNRRLYLAALDVIKGGEKLIDLAYKYGYETPESFTKAFGRFHGVSPTQLRKEPSHIKIFSPLRITIDIKGGSDMNFVMEKENAFKVIGFIKDFSFKTSYQEIPKFWEEKMKNVILPLCKGKKPENEVEETVVNCNVGEYGVCFNDGNENGIFSYLIAGRYTEGEVPEGMAVYEFPELEWAKFPCRMETLQSVNTSIFKEWLPNNPDYEIAMEANVEWYSNDERIENNCAIWVPVVKKK